MSDVRPPPLVSVCFSLIVHQVEGEACLSLVVSFPLSGFAVETNKTRDTSYKFQKPLCALQIGLQNIDPVYNIKHHKSIQISPQNDFHQIVALHGHVLGLQDVLGHAPAGQPRIRDRIHCNRPPLTSHGSSLPCVR